MISIAALIYRSVKYADWLHRSLMAYTPMIERGEAEFYFIANDPTAEIIDHLESRRYLYYLNVNPRISEEELFKMGYAGPEYIHRVYRGWNEAIRRARGEQICLINSDNFVSPDWLENLEKFSGRGFVVCSQLVERIHPKYGVYPGALHGEFGSHPDNFDEPRWLRYVKQVKFTGLSMGGAYMPCLLDKAMALKAGLYPEGNISGGTWKMVREYGDQAFFRRLAELGVKHVTAMDSLVYHTKEGEMEE